jgi:hypothetical protein
MPSRPIFASHRRMAVLPCDSKRMDSTNKVQFAPVGRHPAIPQIFWWDAPLTALIHELGLDDALRREHRFTLVARAPGHFAFALVVALALVLWHPWRAQAAGILLWSCLISGVSCWLLKWVTGRPRPDHVSGIASTVFHPFFRGWSGLLTQRGVSMPSGDASLAFALAACLTWALPRGRWWFFAWASLVAAGRVLFNAHHLSDVLSGAALGLLSFQAGHFAGSRVGAWTANRFEITSNRLGIGSGARLKTATSPSARPGS